MQNYFTNRGRVSQDSEESNTEEKRSKDIMQDNQGRSHGLKLRLFIPKELHWTTKKTRRLTWAASVSLKHEENNTFVLPDFLGPFALSSEPYEREISE